MNRIYTCIETEINPTESEEKVKQAIENVFSPTKMEVKPLRKSRVLVAEGEGQEVLVKFCNLLRRERIRSAARSVLYKGIDGNTVAFCLNKQVAYSGHLSFSEEEAESSLGPLKVKIESEDPRELIDWLAPKIATRT